MTRRTMVLAAVTTAAVVTGTAAATNAFKPKIGAGRYNPARADITLAANSVVGAGEPGSNEGKGWVLAVDPQAAANGASADLTVKDKKLAGLMILTELGFDIFTPGGFNTFDRGSICGTGLRFDFENSHTGGVYSLNCAQGTHTDLENGWTRVRFTNDEQVATLAGPAWPGFGVATVDFIQLLNDGGEGGGVDLIDNFDVNGTLVAQ